MSHQVFKQRAARALRDAGAADIDVFTGRYTQGGERTFGVRCSLNGQSYEASMVHGDADDVHMRRIIHACSRFIEDIAQPANLNPRQK